MTSRRYHLNLILLQTPRIVAHNQGVRNRINVRGICHQNRLLYTLNNETNRLNNENKYFFLGCENIGNTNVFFYNIKNRFF